MLYGEFATPAPVLLPLSAFTNVTQALDGC
jgi:hypothetical protein